MAKPAAAGRRSRAEKKGKKKKFKKKERKNVPFGIVLHSGVVQQHHRDHHRPAGQRAVLEELRLARLPRSRKGTPFAAQQAAHRTPPTWRAITACARSMCASAVPARAASPRSARWPPRASKFVHPRRHADSAQRLPSAEAPQSVRSWSLVIGQVSVIEPTTES